MANSDKNILITPNRGANNNPKIDFVGANANVGPQTISLNVYPDSNGTLSWEGSAGQLFSITNDLTGTIFSVNDVSGIPSIEVNADGNISMAQFGGAVIVGNTSPLQTRIITTGDSITAGTITGNWSLSTGSKLNATYADLAERYVADQSYEPGTVLSFAGQCEVSAERIADSHTIAGVVSTNPAYLMNSDCQGEHVVELALIGRVPCKVTGLVKPGDLMVTSAVRGYAMANNNARAGTIIGKAIGSNISGNNIIEVLVNLM